MVYHDSPGFDGQKTVTSNELFLHGSFIILALALGRLLIYMYQIKDYLTSNKWKSTCDTQPIRLITDPSSLQFGISLFSKSWLLVSTTEPMGSSNVMLQMCTKNGFYGICNLSGMLFLRSYILNNEYANIISLIPKIRYLSHYHIAFFFSIYQYQVSFFRQHLFMLFSCYIWLLIPWHLMIYTLFLPILHSFFSRLRLYHSSFFSKIL